MNLSTLKHWLLPKNARVVTILRGPFRGAKLYAVPADSMRKVFGLYEHELNDWLLRVLPRVDLVLDVGANDGYFTFGCTAAFQRLNKEARIIAYEPEAIYCKQLADSLRLQTLDGIEVKIEQAFVGKEFAKGHTTLDAVASNVEPRRALIKIDVEGAERDVIEGAAQWMNPSNYFLIEVHRESDIDPLRARFSDCGLTLEMKTQRALPFLGPEVRPQPNWWLVTPAP